jgi:hypothetical protein
MITRLGLVCFLVGAVGLLLLSKRIPLNDSLQSSLLSIVFIALGILTLVKTDEVISPIFASSRLIRCILKALGLVLLVWGSIGFLGLIGHVLGFW